jgi:hypothetical protein
VVAISDPDVPVIVIVLVPNSAELLAVSTSIVEPMLGLGVSDAVTPLGNLDRLRLTLPENPYSGFT